MTKKSPPSKSKLTGSLKLDKSFKSSEARRVYKEVRSFLEDNQKLVRHPKTPNLPKDQWKTIAHNAACYAAWTVDKTKVDIVIDVDSVGNELKKHKIKKRK
jgi:hypothetical protein